MLDVVYRRVRGQVSEPAGELTAEQLRTAVPATPAWTVHELLAHLVGVAADTASGRMDGAPGDQWTARHVGERRGCPVHDLLAEWDLVGPIIELRLADEASVPNMAFDIVCHEGDLREALGLTRPERDSWQPVLGLMVGFGGRRLKQPGTLTIREQHGQEWSFGAGQPQTLLRADGYELLRGTFSRRSQRQIAAWNWTPAPPARIGRFGAFGPREDDQPVPVA